MFMLVNCSSCHTPLQLPPGARSIRCAICQAVTHVADPRSVPPPSSYTPPLPSASHPPPPAPSPYGQAPPGPIPNAHGRKRAVICGISYRYTTHELKGCINDANCMRYLLINKYQFPQDSIIMLTEIKETQEHATSDFEANILSHTNFSYEISAFDASFNESCVCELKGQMIVYTNEEETDPYKIPTKYNIRMALYWLVQGCQAGDSLVFHYSGHGSRQRNYNGDEVDGYDETLCPLDFKTQGMIVDDEINATIVRPLPHGVKLHAIIDACHSGTVLDLPFLCRMDRTGRYIWEDHRPRSGVWKGTSGGEVISFSGCDDDQTSADTSALSRIASTGAMTFCFIQAIERGHGSTYGGMLNSMRSAIRSTGNDMGGGAVTSLLTMLLTGGSVSGGLRQEPQLTACQPFDVYTTPFSL